ncbi:dihydroxy-acid dehydratase [Paraburkholderia sp. Ac-20342]|uniref:dihydroxy-acid dehydratase n=1 Tax=Paraburkholderia sp. Ac-20342 TaxID=2703889 RepID=UPI00197F30A7|nr:dihydroxy-acid dehydratase [Paraburkholderia sp. Ac-20342]MBN3846016.1 dihydroxy-acid dehydratase [Paraburkholderia sp. Ac-20342]
MSEEQKPQRPLRSNFPRGSYLGAVRAAQWRNLGISEEDLDKPKIAIVNSSSELATCFSHLDGIAAQLKEAIRAAGALPFEIRTAAPSDFITGAGARGAYMLAARDLVTNDIEVAVEGAQLDGMVCLASCDKTVPGQLMAAARLSIPTIVVACGYQPSGEYRGEHVDIEDVFVGAMHTLTGKLPVEDLIGMSQNAIRGPGVCSGLGTANSMHMVSEALGMSLPGSTPVAANSEKMFAFVREAGARIVEMVRDDLKPRDILTRGAFANAVKTVLAVGGSINTVKHMQAVAAEGGIDVDVYALFEEFAAQIPVLTGVRPVGSHTIEQLEAAGGGRGVMKRLEAWLDTGALTVTGRTVKDNLQDVWIADDEVIRTPERAFANHPAIVLVRGNLAPQAGIVKFGISPDKQRTFTGKALCYSTSDDAIAAIKDGRIQPGNVVVMRGAGVCGGPAMGGGASRVVFAIDGAGLSEQVAMLTDGHLSGLVCKGLVVAEVSPEAATGGPLALVEDGDTVEIDLERRVCNLQVDEAEVARRRAAWQRPAPVNDTGWLKIYRATVGTMPQGAVLGADRPARER